MLEKNNRCVILIYYNYGGYYCSTAVLYTIFLRNGSGERIELTYMGKIISVANQKGGVGKTTTAVNISAALCRLGSRVLLCDTDPQGNATTGYGVARSKDGLSLYDVMVRGEDIKSTIKKTEWGDIIPADIALAASEIELVDVPRREYLLKDALAEIRNEYDYIIIDCPPSLGLLTVNSLTASDSVLVPMQCEYYALEGLSQLINTIKMVRRGLNPQLEIEGIVLTMFDGRTNLSVQVADEIKKHFAGKVFATPVPRNIRFSEAPSHGKPVIAYDKYSRGAESYLKIADELLQRNAEQAKKSI